MKAGWEVKPLGEVCEKITDGSHNPPKGVEFSDFFMLSSKNVWDDRIILDKPRFLSEGDFWNENKRTDVTMGDVLLTIVGTIGRCAVVSETDRKFTLQRSVAVLKPLADHIDSRFLMYALQSMLERLVDGSQGAAQKGIYLKALRVLPIPIPPLEEQKRIVAVLDAAFEGLTRAKENAEANLQNARDLFEASQAKLLSDAGGGWFRKTISDCFKLKSGDGLTAKAMVHGEYAVYGGNGVAGHHNASNLTGENVIIGRVGALCGNARLIETDIWLTDNAFLVTDFQHDFDLPFLTFMLNFMNLRSFARQTAQPVISNSSLKDVVLSFPESRSTQTDIALKLLEIENEVEGLETNYRTKLTDISDLRQSLLQKAFAGDLT